MITLTETTTDAKRFSTHPLPAAKRSRPNSASNPAQTNPLLLKPLGNLLFNPHHAITRTSGLGNLSILPDELLLGEIISKFSGEELVNLQGVSRFLYALSRIEGVWKGLFIAKSRGILPTWSGSWRASYLTAFLKLDLPLPTDEIRTPQVHSDVLFQPVLCSSFDPTTLLGRNKGWRESVKRKEGRGIQNGELGGEPLILTGLMEEWAGFSPDSSTTQLSEPLRHWSLPNLTSRFPTTKFRAEATLVSLPIYSRYHNVCPSDESPLYLFESGFVEKTAALGGEEKGLGEDYKVPECFGEDLFSVMGEKRPDYRWLIAGPTRSGSTFHQDPNSTSAWNAVTQGAKHWILFRPGVTPPGVTISACGGEVEGPLSLAEWFMSYYKISVSTYGSNASDSATRGQMLEGICRAGEIFYVPHGWWHIVVNLEDSIAVTQNFVSRRELPSVLRFMRDRPEQVSGFKLSPTTPVLPTSSKSDSNSTKETEDGGAEEEGDDLIPQIYETFLEALQSNFGGERWLEEALVEAGIGSSEEKDEKKELELEVKEIEKGVEMDGAGFSFGFFDEGESEGDDEEGIIKSVVDVAR